MDSSEALNLLVLSPAGVVYEGDNVKWYDQSEDQIVNNYFNIGDMVVYDSTLKMFNTKSITPVKIISPTDEDVESYKSYDAVALRASNFIHNNMQWHRAVEVLEKLDLPVYAIGVGGQANSREHYVLNDENLRMWKMISERSSIIGVRGTFTAEMLYNNGIKNVEICGCPSMYRTRNRDLKIEPPTTLDNVAISIRREVDSTYTPDIRRYTEMQRDFVYHASQQADVTITIHGEPEEKAFFYKRKELMEAAKAEFLHSGWWSEDTQAQMQKLYEENLFFFLKVADYESFISTQDAAVGYRVHGVLPAMSLGVPGVLVRYDSRSSELADAHALPSISPEDAATKTLRQIFDEADFDAFNKSYKSKYDKMKFVLEHNGIPHRL